MTSIDDILTKGRSGGYRRVKTVDLFDPDLVERHALMEMELERAAQDDMTQNRTPLAPQVAAQIAGLESEISDTATSFRFGALSQREWADLLAAHPPTKEQVKQANAASAGDWRRRIQLDYNLDTLPPALVAACCTDPAMTEAESAELSSVLGPDQWHLLWSAAVEVNQGGASAPKSVMAAGLIARTNGLSVNTAASEESLAANS